MRRSFYVLAMLAMLAMLGILASGLIGCRSLPKTTSEAPTLSRSAPQTHTPSHAAPDFSLSDLQGKQVHLTDFKGKVVILDFWATWCPPCREEIPHLIKFYDQYKDKGVAVVGISVDDDGLKSVKPFAEEFKINYPVLLATEQVQTAYAPLEGIPTKVIIDKNGNIVARLVGYQEITTLEKKIQPLH